MSPAENRIRQATDVSLLNQLVLEVYLAAWTMAGVEHEHTLRPVAASSDDVDDGETVLDVIDLDHFIRATWGLDFGGHGVEIAERRRLSPRRGQRRLPQADPAVPLSSLRDRQRRLARRCDVQQHRPCTSTERSDRTCLSASPRSEHVGSVCYTTSSYLMDQCANCWKGGSCVDV
jgi:hypothetical protein